MSCHMPFTIKYHHEHSAKTHSISYALSLHQHNHIGDKAFSFACSTINMKFYSTHIRQVTSLNSFIVYRCLFWLHIFIVCLLISHFMAHFLFISSVYVWMHFTYLILCAVIWHSKLWWYNSWPGARELFSDWGGESKSWGRISRRSAVSSSSGVWGGIWCTLAVKSDSWWQQF